MAFAYRNFVVYMYLFYFTGRLKEDITEECRENSLTFYVLDGTNYDDLLHFDVVITTYAVLLFDLYISFFSGLILIALFSIWVNESNLFIRSLSLSASSSNIFP